MAKEEASTVQELSQSEVDALLDVAGNTAVVAPDEKTNTLFTNTIIKNESILDEALSEEEAKEKLEKIKKEKDGESILEDVIAEEHGEGEDNAEGDDKKTPVAPKEKTEVSAPIKAITQLIKEGLILPFEGETPIEDYNAKDIAELIKTNFAQNKADAKEEVTTEFFESISSDLQHLAKFEMDGGQDLKGEMRKLLATLEVRDLDPTKEEDQDKIIEQWLTDTNYGTPEEIKQEIIDIRDRNKSEEKAKQYKPKLDAKNAEKLTKDAAKQESLKKKRIEATQKYSESIYNTLVKGELGGIKLTKKHQDMIYNGLTESQYPSITGKPTTKLGHLLEKYQVLEPDHAKIAKVMWLLEDEAGYEEALKNKGSMDTNTETLKKLKQAEADKTGSADSGNQGSADESNRGKKVVTRQKKSLFDRD